MKQIIVWFIFYIKKIEYFHQLSRTNILLPFFLIVVLPPSQNSFSSLRDEHQQDTVCKINFFWLMNDERLAATG